jgi:hypothetical protein
LKPPEARIAKKGPSCGLPSRTGETETVGEILAHGSPEKLLFFLRKKLWFIVVTFKLLVLSGDILPLRARTACAATAATFTTLEGDTVSTTNTSYSTYERQIYLFSATFTHCYDVVRIMGKCTSNKIAFKKSPDQMRDGYVIT